ncbi:MAG: alpha-N-arabinofuranosidase [Oscillospiraceae bacterium]|nr:alpha-N-arabinofuranosidase [Oscillospiraceae bacterium]
MATLKMTIDKSNKLSKINKNIYGHFSEHLGRCIYGGIYVGKDSPIPNINGFRKDVVEAFKAIKLPVLRWPGGCFADTYHWMDGIGPLESRKKIVNIHWGGVTEDNSFGTHEFLDFCELVGCDAYVSVNVGSGTIEEAANWVEYMTSANESPMTELRKKNGREEPWKVKFIGIGNENWGCGGNMSAEYYSDVYNQFQCFLRGAEKIACGPNSNDIHWTDVMMNKSSGFGKMQGLSLHYYTIPTGNWGKKGSSTDFEKDEYYASLSRTWYMERILRDQKAVMQRYNDINSKHTVGLVVDEWGIWADVIPGTNPGFLYQQNSMRDAMVAAINLNLFNLNSDRVKMANIAQVVNVLQAIILTEGEKMVKTPTYHVFDMFTGHMEADLVYSSVENKQILDDNYLPAISQSVSVDADGKMHITIANASVDEEFDIDCVMPRAEYTTVSAKVLSGEFNACNTFDAPDAVAPVCYDGVKLDGEKLAIKLPKCSVISIELA